MGLRSFSPRRDFAGFVVKKKRVLLRGTIKEQPSKHFALLLQRKRYGDCGIKFLRLAVDQHRLIPPLSNGLKRRLRERIVSRQNLNFRDFPLLVDIRMKNNISLDAGGARLRRVFRIRLCDD